MPTVSRLLEIDSRERVWIPGPLSSTMNLFAAVHAAWVGARTTRLPQGATHAHLTPPALARALEEGVDLRRLHVVVAGDRLSTDLADRAHDRGARVSHYYGAAELSFVAWASADGRLRPFPGVDVEVRRGEIWVRSPYLSRGYLGAGGEWRTDADGFATVGDRGELHDGHLVVHGRADAAITTGAATVLVADIEDALRPAAGDRFAVVGLPHPALGQVVAAALTEPGRFGEVRARAARELSPAQRPRRWFALESMPVTAAGKLDRAALVEALVSRPVGVQVLT